MPTALKSIVMRSTAQKGDAPTAAATSTGGFDRVGTLRRAVADASSGLSGGDPLTKAEELRARVVYSEQLHRLSTVDGVKALLGTLGVVSGTHTQLIAEFAAGTPSFSFNGHRLPPVDAVLGILRRRKREAQRAARQQASVGGEVRAFLSTLEETGDVPLQSVADLVEATIGAQWTKAVKDDVVRSAIAEAEMGSMRTPKAGTMRGPHLGAFAAAMNDGPMAMTTTTTVARPNGLPDDLDINETSLHSAPVAGTPSGAAGGGGADGGTEEESFSVANESFVMMGAGGAGGLNFQSFDFEMDARPNMSSDFSFDANKSKSLRARRASQAAAAAAALSAVDRCVLAHRRKLKAIREQGVKTVGPLAAITATTRSRSPGTLMIAGDGGGRRSPIDGSPVLSPAALRLLEEEAAQQQHEERRGGPGRAVVIASQQETKSPTSRPILIVDPNGSLVSDSRLWKSPEQREATSHRRRTNAVAVVDDDVVAMMNTSQTSLTASERREAQLKIRRVPSVVKREEERRQALLQELGIELNASSPTGFVAQPRAASAASSTKPRRVTRLSYHLPPPPPTADEIVWSLHQQAFGQGTPTHAVAKAKAVVPRSPPRRATTPPRRRSNHAVAERVDWSPGAKRKTAETLSRVVVLCDYTAPFSIDVTDCRSIPELVSFIDAAAPLLPPGVAVSDVYVEDPDGQVGQFVPLDSLNELHDIAYRCVLEKRDLRLRAMLNRIGNSKLQQQRKRKDGKSAPVNLRD